MRATKVAEHNIRFDTNGVSDHTEASYVYASVIDINVGVTVPFGDNGRGANLVKYNGRVYHPPYNLMGPYTIASLNESLWGGLSVTSTTGTTYHYSTREKVESTKLVFGEEYLQAFHSSVNFTSGDNNPSKEPIKIVLSGDSTTVGVGASSDAFKPHVQLASIAAYSGYSHVKLVNKGVSGGSTFQWKDLWIDGELAENPKLLVLRWGVNDPSTASTTVESFEYSLRQGLDKIRNLKSVNELSILLMTPCMTDNDAGTRRVEEWHVAINQAIRRAARDYLCCFIDTSGALSDAKNSAGIWMDAVDATSTKVHPLDILYTKIAMLMANVIFPLGFTLARTNAVINIPTWQGEATGAEQITSYSSGVTLQRLISSDASQPINGIVAVLKHCEGAGIEMATPYYGVTYGKAINFRSSFKNSQTGQGSGNAPWTGVDRVVIPLNGWTSPSNFKPLSYRLGVDGLLHFCGTLTVGELTAGTVIFNIGDPYFRPSVRTILPCIVDIAGGSSACQLSVGANGDVTYSGPTSGVYRLHVVGSIFL